MKDLIKKDFAVFLDRDGTINKDLGYIYRIIDFQLFDFSIQAIKKLNQLNVLTIVISNQSGVARGYFNEEFVLNINNKMRSLLQEGGASIDGIYYCPHLPDGTVKEFSIECNCRKPKTGMILIAEQDFDINLKKSFMIGDKISDIQLGKKLNMTSILVLTGYGRKEYTRIQTSEETKPDHVAENLLEAVNFIQERINKI